MAEPLRLIEQLILCSSWARFQKYTRRNSSQLIAANENNSNPQLPLGDEISIIIMWGVIGWITLKIHFTLNDAIHLASIGFNSNRENTTEKMALEYLKEFSNLQAGYLKGYFESLNIPMGMSLPFLAKGTDEHIFRKIRDPRAHVITWKILDQGCTLNLTGEFCILDGQTISKYQEKIEAEIKLSNQPQTFDDDGDINFL